MKIKFSNGKVKLNLESNSQLLNKFKKVFTLGSPFVSWSKGSRVLFATTTSIRWRNFIVTNTLYPSIEKQKVKINGSMVRRKGLFGMV